MSKGKSFEAFIMVGHDAQVSKLLKALYEYCGIHCHHILENEGKAYSLKKVRRL